MAKFNVEFDTETKSLVVMRDGSQVDNVESVEMYKSYPYNERGGENEEERFSIRVTQKMEEKDMITYIHVMANETMEQKFNSTLEEAIAKHYGVL